MSGPERRSQDTGAEHVGPMEHEHSYPGTSAAAAPGHGGKARLSIWFFVGTLCLMYGLVLIPVGVWEFSHPSETALRLPLLLKLHATFWWGLLLTAFGGFYAVRFRPGTV